jgi:hypothetical protein
VEIIYLGSGIPQCLPGNINLRSLSSVSSQIKSDLVREAVNIDSQRSYPPVKFSVV